MGTASTELRPRQFVLDYATLIVLFIAFAIIYFGTSPKQRDWNPEDPLIQWPYRESTVGDAAAFFLATLFPAVIFIVVFLVKRSKLDVHNAFLGLFLALLLMLTNVEWMKNTFGELRPDFAARCKWDATNKTCTGDPAVINEGRKSFPSGHAGIMFTTYSYTVLWLIGKFKPWRQGFAPILLLINILCSLAMYVLATRITDNKHHTWDVGGGAVFGIVFGSFSYFLYYPNPFGSHAGLPKNRPESIRDALLQSLRDEPSAPEAHDAQQMDIEQVV